MKRCKGDEYKIMKELIYLEYIIKLENINNVIDLIDGLDDYDKRLFMEELMEKCQFTK